MHFYPIIVLFVAFVPRHGMKTLTVFSKMPVDLNLAGYKCAWDHYRTNLAVRYNLLSGQCEAMDNTTVSNQPLEDGYNYFRLRTVEPKFTPTLGMEIEMPELRSNGMTIVMYVEKVEPGISGFQIINFNALDSSLIVLHVKMLTNEDNTAFNQKYPEWRDEIYRRRMYDPAALKMYKLEFIFMIDTIDIYIDGEVLLKFPNQVPSTEIETIIFQSNITLCHRVQFVYPQ